MVPFYGSTMPTPKSIGRYEVQRVLGHGAMGVVYLARDPILQRLVAIKAMREQTSDMENTRERFRREAEISAKLNHPNVITVFDVGDDPEVGAYLAMEFVDGRSLAQLVREGLPVEAGLQLLIQGMGALKAAEAQGIVHRDIKPENILVSADGRFKLMDFGIARRGESKLTQAGMVFGTPSYTAPELLVGAEANAATDRYAFAVTAFEIITGTVPYHGASIGTMLYKIVHESPSIPQDMDSVLERVFSRALAKSPEGRYPDLRSFMIDLVQAAPIPEEARIRLAAQLEEDRGPLETRIYPPALVAQRQAAGDVFAGLPPPEMGEGPGPWSGTPAPFAASGGHPALVAVDLEPSGSEAAARGPVSKSTWMAAGILLVLTLGAAGGYLLWSRPRLMTLNTRPGNATVFVDGQRIGTTPIAGVEIPKGAQRMLFQLEGHLPKEVALAGQGNRLEIELEAIPYTIRVVTDPPGAEVLLNGKPVGRTPLEALSVPSTGKPQLQIRMPGYEEWNGMLEKDLEFPEVIRLNPSH
jgi:serine/threonine-protein kinase